MGFFLLVVYLILTFIRPFELYPSLAPYRIMFSVGILAIAGTVISLIIGRRPTFRANQIYLMLGLMVMVALSLIITERWFGGALQAIQHFSVVATIFFLVILNVTTLRRLRIVVVLLVLLSSVLVVQGVLAYHYGYREETFVLNQLLDARVAGTMEKLDDGKAYYGDRPILRRIRSLGFLHDPNDLAQVLLVMLPFIGVAWRRGLWFRNFVLVCVPISFLLYGVFLTRSRGGMLGLMVLVLLALRNWLGRSRAIVLTALVVILLLALNFSGGRSISSLDSSAQGRLEAWSEGIQILKTNPLWGAGYGSFLDFSERGAHSSFVLAFSELGLIGYFFWLALIVVTIFELSSLRKRLPEEPLDRELSRWAGAIELSLYTFLVGAWFLTRTYIVTLYLLLALGVAVVDLARRAEKPINELPLLGWASRVGALEIASVLLIYMMVQLHF